MREVGAPVAGQLDPAKCLSRGMTPATDGGGRTCTDTFSCHIWFLPAPSPDTSIGQWCWCGDGKVCGAELGGLNLNFKEDVLEAVEMMCCGDSFVHSSVEVEIQLPTELREGLCWFELEPSPTSELLLLPEEPVPFGHWGGIEHPIGNSEVISCLIQGCRRTSSSKILCMASIRRHCAIKSWHSVNTRRRIDEIEETQRAFLNES